MPNSDRPAKLVKFSHSDTNIIDLSAGGSGRYFKEVDSVFKNSLISQIDISINDLNSDMAAMVVELESKALAKSHRPVEVFNDNTCPFIGDIGINPETKTGNFIVRATRGGLDLIRNKIKTSDADYYKQALSTILSLHLFQPAIDLQMLDETHEILIELIDFKNDAMNEQKMKIYNDKIHQQEIESRALIDNKIFHIKISDRQKTLKFINFLKGKNVLMSAKTDKFINFQPLSLTENSIDIDLPQADDRKNYPVVGVVDTCIKKDCPDIKSWHEGEITALIEEERDYSHGTFVAGLITNSFILNSNDDYFPKSQSKVFSVGALGIDGAKFHEIIDILERAQKERPDIKIWNLSLGSSDPVELTKISDFGMMLDRFQKENNCICVIAAGNIDNISDMRIWPPKEPMPKDEQRISSPGDSVLGITVSSVSQIDGIVKRFEPSIFSRSGPIANYVLKPDLNHFGGNNIQNDNSLIKLGVTSLSVDSQSKCVYGQDCGTSFSTPLVSTIAANLWKLMGDDTPRYIIKGLLAHSARLHKKIDKDDKLYYGWGMPLDIDKFMFCNENEITIIMDGEIGSNREIVGKLPFPIPESLRTVDGKVRAEFIMTTSYDPPLDENRAFEYCLVNVEAGLGEIKPDGNFSGKVPSEGTGYEQDLVNAKYKWSPVKINHKKFPSGVGVENWKLQVKMLTRQGFTPDEDFIQPFCIILTVRALDDNAQVYNEMVRLMNELNWEVSNAIISVEQPIRF